MAAIGNPASLRDYADSTAKWAVGKVPRVPAVPINEMQALDAPGSKCSERASGNNLRGQALRRLVSPDITPVAGTVRFAVKAFV